jgi:hypothetical protein
MVFVQPDAMALSLAPAHLKRYADVARLFV